MKELVRSAATFALVVLLFWRGGLTGALWALVLNECILLALGLYWTRAALFQPFARMPLSEFKPYFVFGVAFYVPAFLFSLLQRSGNVFIQALTGAPESVAHYDVANQFLVLTATFLGVIFMTLLPALSNLHARAEHATIARWNRVVMTYCGAVVFLAFHTLVLAGRPLIQVWLGSDFAPVYPTALILCAALPPALMVYAGMNFALLENRPGPFAAGVCGGWVAMAAAGLLLIPRHGAIGAAWAPGLGFAIPAATLAARYRDLFMPMLAGFGKAWLPGLIIMTVYWAEIARSWPIPVCLGSALFYILLLFSFRIISVSDFKKVMAAFGRKTT